MKTTEYDAIQKYIERIGIVYPMLEGRILMNGTDKLVSNYKSASSYVFSTSVPFVIVVAGTILNYIHTLF